MQSSISNVLGYNICLQCGEKHEALYTTILSVNTKWLLDGEVAGLIHAYSDTL